MDNQERDAEAALRTLAKRLQQGWAKMHPVPENVMQRVRDAVKQQWQEQQAARSVQTSEGAKPSGPTQEKQISEEPAENKKQNQRHSQ